MQTKMKGMQVKTYESWQVTQSVLIYWDVNCVVISLQYFLYNWRIS